MAPDLILQLFAVALGSTMGIAFAGNLFTLFIFYELLTLSTYPLVTHAGDDAARESGRMYLGYLLGTSVILLLLALIWTWSLTGTLDFRAGGILEGTVTPGIASILLVLFISASARPRSCRFTCGCRRPWWHRPR